MKKDAQCLSQVYWLASAAAGQGRSWREERASNCMGVLLGVKQGLDTAQECSGVLKGLVQQRSSSWSAAGSLTVVDEVSHTEKYPESRV